MSCTLGPLVEEANQAATAAYDICEVDPSGLKLTPEELEITQESSWCQWQPTYNAPDISGYLPTLVTQVKDKVYDELMANLRNEIDILEANAALVYSTKIERVAGDAAMAGKIDASYAQWESGSTALASSVQTALASQGYALSQQILQTEASLDDKITANSEFYQTSLASVGETMAASGVLNSVTLPDGSKVVSGFRSQASSETGSEFTIFADTFKILNRTPNGTGGYDYSSVLAPFTVQNDTVYIGKVNTSEPQITYLGEFASAPSTTGLDKNTVYKNTVDGNSYIFNGTGWVVWLVKGATGPAGANGANGANGSRGASTISYSALNPSTTGTSLSSYFSAAGYSDKVLGDSIILTNTSTTSGWTKTFRRLGTADVWSSEVSLIVSGDTIVKGTLAADALTAGGTITGQSLSLSSGNSWTTSGTMYVSTIAGCGSITSSNQISCKNLHTYGSGGPYSAGISATGSSGTGIFGAGNYAIVADNGGSYGFWTAGTCWFEGAAYPFTGAHIGVVAEQYDIGDIMVAVDSKLFSIDQNVPTITIASVAKDRRVFGVLSRANKGIYEYVTASGLLSTAIEGTNGEPGNRVVKPEYIPIIEQYVQNGYYVGHVNAIGEGGINVCSEGGDIEVGDYICSSNVPGKGMKQDDDIMHSYTVAKALEAVVWANEPATTKMIACTYHCG